MIRKGPDSAQKQNKQLSKKGRLDENLLLELVNTDFEIQIEPKLEKQAPEEKSDSEEEIDFSMKIEQKIEGKIDLMEERPQYTPLRTTVCYCHYDLFKEEELDLENILWGLGKMRL